MPLPLDEDFPSLTEGHIARLEAMFPDRAPDLHKAEKEIWFEAGQASVVRKLRALYEDQKG